MCPAAHLLLFFITMTEGARAVTTFRFTYNHFSNHFHIISTQKKEKCYVTYKFILIFTENITNLRPVSVMHTHIALCRPCLPPIHYLSPPSLFSITSRSTTYLNSDFILTKS